MVLTAVFTAIAVIAAMVTVPWTKADAAEPVSGLVADNTLGPDSAKPAGMVNDWGELVWAGKPVAPKGHSNPGNPNNNAGWGWCIDLGKPIPARSHMLYKLEDAAKLPALDSSAIVEGVTSDNKAEMDAALRNASINVATKLKQAYAAKDSALASNYARYLSALIGDATGGQNARDAFANPEKAANDLVIAGFYDNFTGSMEEFRQLTGFTVSDQSPYKLVKDPNVNAPEAPEGAYITVVGPDGHIVGNVKGQRVMPPDQPGLPGDEGESKTPSIKTQAKFAEGSTQVVAGAKVEDTVTYEGLVPGKEYTLFAELISKADGETVLGKGEETFTPVSANGEVVVEITVDESVKEPVEAAVAFEELTSVEVNDKGEETPGTDPENPNHIAEHKDINDKNQTVPKSGDDESGKPKISTNADFANGATEVVAGAQVNDRVTYENLVPGKEYTLFAELISKEDGKTVLGEGEKTFTPVSANGEVVVEITVDESVKEPVEAAVAFEELTSVEVNDKGEETPGTDPENPNHIAEHKDINDKNQTVTSDSDKPSDTPDKGDGKDNDGDKGSSKKDLPWWLLLIPGLGLIKIIADGGHNGGNGGHDGGNGGHDGGNNHGESHDNTGRDDREVTVLDATPPEDAANQPQDFGQPVPSNTHRVEIKHVPSGATQLDPGMQDFIK